MTPADRIGITTDDNPAPDPADQPMSDLIAHLEKYLGRIQGGWSKTFDGDPMPFNVAVCENGVLQGTTAFVTVGLSHSPLPAPASDKLIRHELLMVAWTEQSKVGIPGVLQQLGNEALQRHTAFLRGDVIGPRGVLFPDTPLEAIYFAIPTCFPDGFGACEISPGKTVVIAWLIPITASEAAYVRSHGWRRFEALLVEKNPDLTNLNRRRLL